jgi:hypothetical protein
MTFWQFLTNIFIWIEGRTTRAIALALGTVTTLVGTGIIPETQLKYYAAGISILTYWRAQSISNKVNEAKAIVQQQHATDVVPVLVPAKDPKTS